MPTVQYDGDRIECERGVLLRDALLEAGLTPHNGTTDRLNCGGRATCGTCAVRVDGDVSDPTAAEKRRLGVPPLRGRKGLRLACQTAVRGDLEVTKGDGFWGQKLPPDESSTTGQDAEPDRRPDAPDSTE
ncbi:2Fe-2S iron-sulfur cluster-binding protein [Halobiforma nitratireducens]|uniref:Ferredoxin n=1 Tax=Halobiforma nitratireducens JCM 10879 TaxID=1227454 RepID=M0M522_9EURY|nr:2Fe-2S iron-sulfur cluster-binding protein [Halobiforma nitratireducens]EMA40907.1 ferredoxin [Halobiforma nitratireducens JCM 10879]